MGPAGQMRHGDSLLNLNDRQHRPRLPRREFAGRTHMMQRPADIGRRRFWIDLNNLGNC